MENNETQDQPTAPETEWVIRVYLGVDVQDADAEKWMDAVVDAVLSHDSGFSGIISMTKEPIE